MEKYEGTKEVERFAQTFLRGFLKSRNITHLDAIRMALHAFNFQNRVFDEIPSALDIIQKCFNDHSVEEQKLVYHSTKFMEDMEHEFYKALEKKIREKIEL